MTTGPVLNLVLTARDRPSPIDGADVLQALDDWYRIGRRAEELDPQGNEWNVLVEHSTTVGQRHSDLRIEEFRFGSPFTLAASLPTEAYIAAPGALWVLLAGIERLFNFRQNIRTARAEGKAREAQFELEEARARIEHHGLVDQYWRDRLAQSGRHLQGRTRPPEFEGQAGWLDWNDDALGR
jgi:hypothetical protein